MDIHFQLAPGNDVFNHDHFSVRSDFNEGWNVFIRTKKQKGLELTNEEGWVSFEYTKKESRPAFRYRIKKTNKNQPVRFVTLVAPYEKEIPDIKVELVGNPEIGSNNLQLKLHENGNERVIAYNL